MKHRVNTRLPTNLPQLQNLLKRDSGSYVDEFNQQHRHFLSQLEVFKLEPSKYSKELDLVVMFLAQVSQCFPTELSSFPQLLVDILKDYSTVLHPEMRASFCKALILLRNKNLIAPTSLLELFFHLLNCQDKSLRNFLRSHIVTDIKNVNSKHKNMKLNSSLQSFMYGMLKDSRPMAAKMSLDVMTELYSKNVWNDAKTVNVVATALFSKVAKVMTAALRFFLGKDDDKEKKKNDDSESEDEGVVNANMVKDVTFANRVTKTSRRRRRVLQRAKRIVSKDNKQSKLSEMHFSAIYLLHDPHTLGDKLFRRLETMTERFEVKLMTMDLVSRLIGIHKLFAFNFYPYIQRYLRPHQREVTRILLYSAQSVHELIPPDILEPLMKTLLNNFIVESNSNDVVAVGINTVREICCRAPLALDADLLYDLASYRTHKDRSISAASRSLIALYRVVNPRLLVRKHRAKPTAASLDRQPPLEYGQTSAVDYLPGAEVLREERGSDNDDDGDELADSYDEDDVEADIEAAALTELESSAKTDRAEGDSSFGPNPLSVDDKIKKATAVSQNRIFSQEEFHQIKVAQLKKLIEAAPRKGSAQRKRKADGSAAEPNYEDMKGIYNPANKKELPTLDDVEMIHKKRITDKIAKLASIKAGREGRDKFGNQKKWRLNPHSSTSNSDKRKTKAFSMIKHKAKKKVKRSFKEKQLALKKSLLRKRIK